MKRVVFILTSAIALSVVAVPGASAEKRNWTMGGAALTKTETSPFTGVFGFTSTAGGFSCPVKAEVELGPGGAGKVKTFSVVSPSECKFSGGLASVCGEALSKHSITGLPWTVDPTSSGVARITSAAIDLTASGSFCPTITLSGEIVATPDDAVAITEFKLSGSLSSNLGSAVTATGWLAPSEGSGTYGIDFPPVPRVLMHGQAPLMTDVTVEAHGAIGFTSSFGGFSCPVRADILFPWDPKKTDTVASFAPTETAACTYSGQMDSLCGTLDAHLTTGLPWTVDVLKFSDGSYGLRISGLHLDLGGTGVFCPDFTMSGEVFAKGDPHGLSELTLSGELQSNLGWSFAISGTQELTPEGTYEIET